jgi:hypothetical protein
MMKSPAKTRSPPVIHTSAAFSKNAYSCTAMSGARAAMMPGTMTRKGPMTRAKARVRASDSGVAGMASLPSRRVRPKFLVRLSQDHQNNRGVFEPYQALKFKITARL